MLRDRMLFLDLISDPNSSSATERDFANNILLNEFTPGVMIKGGSARSNKIFAAYQTQYLKATQFVSAHASASGSLSMNSQSDRSGHLLYFYYTISAFTFTRERRGITALIRDHLDRFGSFR